MAKNSMLSRRGFSPFQIVFGRNIWNDNAENEFTIGDNADESVKKHFLLKNTVRSQYVKAETDARLEAMAGSKMNNKLEYKFKSIQKGVTVQYYRRRIVRNAKEKARQSDRH